jgi:OOP family OmpA-OmpF porin
MPPGDTNPRVVGRNENQVDPAPEQGKGHLEGGGMMKAILFGVIIAMLAGASGAAAQSQGNPHVDPHAPCFRWPAVDMDEDGVFDRVDHCVNTPKGCTVDAFGCEHDGDHDGVCDGLDQCPDTPAGTKVDAHGCPGAARGAAEPPPVKREEPPPPPPAPPTRPMEKQLIETGRIRLENVYFETGKSTLLPESEESLREAGETLEKFPQLVIEIQGHTDTRGAAGYNLRLSQTRAESVRQFLIDHFQLKPGNLSARGYGETQPETRERNDEELLRNRRVELHVMNPEALPKRVKIENH